MIDFLQSYVTWITHDNSCGRFNLESICKVFDHQSNSTEIFYGLNGVMACDVYGEAPLFYNPSFEFQAIFSGSHVKITRSFYPEQEKDSIQEIKEKFVAVKKELHYLVNEEMFELRNLTDINSVIESQQPIVGQVNIVHREKELELLFPVKHINISLSKQMFQVETGSIIMLDIEKEKEENIEKVTQAFISFNNYNEVDFLFYASDQEGTNNKVRRFCKPLHSNARVKLWTY